MFKIYSKAVNGLMVINECIQIEFNELILKKYFYKCCVTYALDHITVFNDSRVINNFIVISDFMAVTDGIFLERNKLFLNEQKSTFF